MPWASGLTNEGYSSMSLSVMWCASNTTTPATCTRWTGSPYQRQRKKRILASQCPQTSNQRKCARAARTAQTVLGHSAEPFTIETDMSFCGSTSNMSAHTWSLRCRLGHHGQRQLRVPGEVTEEGRRHDVWTEQPRLLWQTEGDRTHFTGGEETQGWHVDSTQTVEENGPESRTWWRVKEVSLHVRYPCLYGEKSGEGCWI